MHKCDGFVRSFVNLFENQKCPPVIFLFLQIISVPVQEKQDAQLSQRDRAAVCVIVFAKSRTLELGDNDLRTL